MPRCLLLDLVDIRLLTLLQTREIFGPVNLCHLHVDGRQREDFLMSELNLPIYRFPLRVFPLARISPQGKLGESYPSGA
jgi:hypothetical protein